MIFGLKENRHYQCWGQDLITNSAFGAVRFLQSLQTPEKSFCTFCSCSSPFRPEGGRLIFLQCWYWRELCSPYEGCQAHPCDQRFHPALELVSGGGFLAGKRQVGEGGKTNCAILGRGQRTVDCALQNQLWRPQKAGLVWSVPVSSEENDRAWGTDGGGKHIIGAGSKNLFGRGLSGMSSHPRSFPPPPLCCSLTWGISTPVCATKPTDCKVVVPTTEPAREFSPTLRMTENARNPTASGIEPERPTNQLHTMLGLWSISFKSCYQSKRY